jgi:uncharacterized membrane protein
MALAGGAAFVVLYPPLQVPDEASHFARAFQVSEGGMLPQRRRGETGGSLPISLQQLMQAGKATFWHSESRIPNAVEFYRDRFQEKLEPESRSFTAFPMSAAEPPLAFLPQAAGIRIARLVSDSAIATMYGARIANLLVAIACILAAICWTPVYKRVFACLGLAPLVVSEMASASAYAFTYGVVFLFAALVLRLSYGEPGLATWRQTAALFVLTAALCLVMQGYFPLVFSYFMIPAARMGGRKRYWLVFAGLAAVAAALVTAWQLAQAPSSALVKAEVDPAAQARQILENPRQFVDVVRASLGTRAPVVHVLSQTYSGFLVTNLLNPSIALLVVCAGLFLFVCFLDGRPGLGRVGLRRRLVPLAVAAATMATTLLFAYLYRTPVGSMAVESGPWQLVPTGLVLTFCLFNLTPRLIGFAAFVRAHMSLFVAGYYLLRFGESAFGVIYRYYKINW